MRHRRAGCCSRLGATGMASCRPVVAARLPACAGTGPNLRYYDPSRVRSITGIDPNPFMVGAAPASRCCHALAMHRPRPWKHGGCRLCCCRCCAKGWLLRRCRTSDRMRRSWGGGRTACRGSRATRRQRHYPRPRLKQSCARWQARLVRPLWGCSGIVNWLVVSWPARSLLRIPRRPPPC